MSIVRLTLTILGTVVYLGLAILGWYGTAAFFRPAGVDLARDGAVRSRRGGGVRRRQSGPRPARGRANRWVLVAFALIVLLQAFLPALTVTPCAGSA